MRERYPESMTIVIQHTFWNLKTDDTGFELDLTFNDIRERLQVPFAAVQAFFDPSVKFGLQFDLEGSNEEGEVVELNALGDATKLPNPSGNADSPQDKPAKSKIVKEADSGTKDKATPREDGDAEVVSLDAFRKKK